MYKIRVNPKATEDLIEIRDYITEEFQNPAAALNVVLMHDTKDITAEYLDQVIDQFESAGYTFDILE